MTDIQERVDGEPAAPAVTEQPAQWGKLAALLAVVGLGVLAAWLTGMLATVAVVSALIVMIMLHELGHYLTARWSGMKVTEFFLGFGPRLWSVRKGETEYGIKAIPAGGYVKIIGMHNLDKVEDPADEPRTYRQKSFPRRLMVVLAGSMMHFLLALVLLWSIFAFVGVPQAELVVGQISRLQGGAPTPAEEAGLRVGDRIVSVDGIRFEAWTDLPPYIQERPGEPLRFVIERDGERVTRTVIPLDLSSAEVEGIPDSRRPKEPTGFVGIAPQITERTEGALGAVPAAFGMFGEMSVGTVKALGAIFSPEGVGDYFSTLTGNPPAAGEGGENRFLSPVGFARVADQAVESGLLDVLQLLVLINVFVGIFNLIPLLPLDGGHVAIASYEAVRSKLAGRRHFVDVSRLLPATYLVFMLLVFIGISSLYLDIVDPIGNPFQ